MLLHHELKIAAATLATTAHIATCVQTWVRQLTTSAGMAAKAAPPSDGHDASAGLLRH